MAGTKKIKTALVSVFHKDGLDELLKKLNAKVFNSFPLVVHRLSSSRLALNARL